MIKKIILLLLATCSVVQAKDTVDYLELSLEELMAIEVYVPGAITTMTPLETPASVTVINSESIQLSPARNIYDLLEIYVPGAFWMNHEEGPHPGIRGIIANRNDKFLLLVNGRKMNNKQIYGAKSELEQWDMGDIEKIEVIRGPGSVTYGPGAIAGVINITTFSGDTREGTYAKTGYLDDYQSSLLSISHGEKNSDYHLFSHFSIVDTHGTHTKHFLVNNDGTSGFVGEDIKLTDETLDYYADYLNNPQIKLHTDINWLNGWRGWLRYTQQGSNWKGNEVKSDFSGELLNQQGTRDRQLTVTLENQDTLDNGLDLTNLISIDSYDAERRKEQVNHPDPAHPLNMESNFAEHELILNSTLNWKPSDETQVATGFEYSYERFGAGWGDSTRDMRLGEDADIVNGPDSNAILLGNNGSADKDGNALFVGSGWSTSTLSIFAEANHKFNATHKLLVSGRADKNSYSDWLFSPRIALVSDLADGHITKLIVQRSVRMNTAGQLYANNLNGMPSDNETIDSLEFIYTARPTSSLSTQLTIFTNELDVIGFQGDVNTTTHVGELNLFGLEAELQYKWGKSLFGLNYSYVKQRDWDMATGIDSSGISYADYNADLGNSIQTGYGNNLNNWSTHALKLYSNLQLSQNWVLHLNARYFSDMDGALDGLQGLQNAVTGTADEAAALSALSRVRAEGVYEADFRFNAKLRYSLSQQLTLEIYALNLYGSNDNKRYAYDTGNDDPTPRRVRYTEEPRAYGIQAQYKF